MNNMNNKPASSPVVRVSRSDAAVLRQKFAARRLEAETAKEVADIKADLRDRFVSEGETLRREMIEDSLTKGARRGARSPSESCFDKTLFAKRLGEASWGGSNPKGCVVHSTQPSIAFGITFAKWGEIFYPFFLALKLLFR